MSGDVCKTDLRDVQLTLIGPVGTPDGVNVSGQRKVKRQGIRLFHSVLEAETVTQLVGASYSILSSKWLENFSIVSSLDDKTRKNLTGVRYMRLHRDCLGKTLSEVYEEKESLRALD